MFTLEEITTSDGLVHQGIVANPSQTTKGVIVWVHGLTSTFYNNTMILNLLAKQAFTKNLAVASFNTRGHDMITSIRKNDNRDPKGYTKILGGAGYEVFEECIQDLEAITGYFIEKGYKKVFFVGHSSGANKVCYYAGTTKTSLLGGVALLCPMSDRLDPRANKEEITQNLEKCKLLIDSGREDALVTTLGFFPMTAKRYVSLVTPLSSEDQFDYGEFSPVMVDYTNISVPLFVRFAEMDEYADRPIKDIKKVFDEMHKSISYQSKIIPNSLHNLKNNEHEVVGDLVDWAASF